MALLKTTGIYNGTIYEETHQQKQQQKMIKSTAPLFATSLLSDQQQSKVIVLFACNFEMTRISEGAKFGENGLKREMTCSSWLVRMFFWGSHQPEMSAPPETVALC